MPKQEKGISHETRPVSKRPPAWCRYTSEEVEAIIVKLSKDGHPPSQIGIILRDQHGVPLSKPITEKSVSQILKERNIYSTYPEDLENLLRKATRLHVHQDKNKSDLHNKRALQMVEAKIYKLSRYYKREGVLPADWKYSPKAISLF
ncbi:MAG: 30S ribosomal protein S15 [Candidatus Bathyarchaeota archaeon]|nr:MAG: 30S ribosomal protein S15 [Candidatus Bathyarchaeum tardum]WNZ29752.1 MAG: 30S ribosomal protein S15 [Candidatus Bathyarchaeota archaeon]